VGADKLSGPGKIAAVFLALVVGLEAFARFTNNPFNLDLLSPNALGTAAQAGQQSTLALTQGASAALGSGATGKVSGGATMKPLGSPYTPWTGLGVK
jgi:hypothetical protein